MADTAELMAEDDSVGFVPEQSSRSIRFAHLLEPIKDIAKSWNIDIAHELQDYLEELESIVFTFDGGATNLNFAEAALVIQGSACIYSRKVEFLYQLVCKTLEMLAMQHRQTSKPSIDEQGRDVDFQPVEDPKFLTLDDDMVEATNIDLDEVTGIGASRIHAALGSAVKQPVHLHARTPMSLLRLADHDANASDPLRRRRSELTRFKLNSSVIDESGTLLLDATDRRTSAAAPAASPAVRGETPTIEAPHEAADQSYDDYGGGGGGGDYMVYDDVADAAGEPASMNIASFAEPALAPEPAQPASGSRAAAGDESLFVVHQRREAAGGGPVARVRFVASAGSAGGDDDERDPWAELDPHDSNAGGLAPFRRGKTTMTLRPVPLQPSFVSSAQADAAASVHAAGPKAIATNAFADLFLAEQRRRRDWWKAEGPGGAAVAASMVLVGGAPEDGDVYGAPVGQLGGDQTSGFDDGAGAAATAAEVYGGAGAAEYDYDYGGGGGGGGGGDYMVMDEGDEGDGEVAPMILSFGDEDHIGPSTRAALHRFEHAGELVPQSYEELCRGYIAGYLKEAARYMQQTDLSKRVDDWQRRMERLLAEEEQRRAFDIHAYGHDLMGELGSLAPPVVEASEPGEPVPFERVVQGKSTADVCRIFLATLQLANDGNVIIEHGPSDVPAPDHVADFSVSLLTVAPKVELSSYRAPSAREVVLKAAGVEPSAAAKSASTAPARSAKRKRGVERELGGVH